MTERNLAEAFVQEQARLRDLLEASGSIGPAGRSGQAMIRQVLARADAASASHDTVAMLRCYEEMKECQ